MIGKMDEDYKKAADKIPAIMKEWHMVHNLVEGLPTPAVEKLNELANGDPNRQFGFIGAVRGLPNEFSISTPHRSKTCSVSSPQAKTARTSRWRNSVISLAHVAAAGDQVTFDVTTIRPVPPQKLEFNNLPSHWRLLISGGWQNAHHVTSYLGNHSDPLVGEKIAQVFRAKYAYLKAQNLTPDAIMSALYETVTGIGNVTPERQVAAQALLGLPL